METNTFKQGLLEAVNTYDIDLLRSRYNNYKSIHGTDLAEQVMLEVLNELTSTPDKLAWLLDNSETSPITNQDNELTGFTLEP